MTGRPSGHGEEEEVAHQKDTHSRRRPPHATEAKKRRPDRQIVTTECHGDGKRRGGTTTVGFAGWIGSMSPTVPGQCPGHQRRAGDGTIRQIGQEGAEESRHGDQGDDARELRATRATMTLRWSEGKLRGEGEEVVDHLEGAGVPDGDPGLGAHGGGDDLVDAVTADVAGVVESPVYVIFSLSDEVDKLAGNYTVKWDGEWFITKEVFHDLGLAFAAVLVLIYILVVGWFESFLTPLLIMAAIPFSLVGILPAHGALNAFFTATSMIGMIALAGIIVRNSILLVDFTNQLREQGMELDRAIAEAGETRFLPILLTSATAIGGLLPLATQGSGLYSPLAIVIIGGLISSTLLARLVTPVMYKLLPPTVEVRPGSGDGMPRH